MSAGQYYGGQQQGGPQYPQQSYGPPGGGPPGWQGDKGMFNNHGGQQQGYLQQGGYGMQQPMQYGPPGGREFRATLASWVDIPNVTDDIASRSALLLPCALLSTLQNTAGTRSRDTASSQSTCNRRRLRSQEVGAVDAARHVVVCLQDCEHLVYHTEQPQPTS